MRATAVPQHVAIWLLYPTSQWWIHGLPKRVVLFVLVEPYFASVVEPPLLFLSSALPAPMLPQRFLLRISAGMRRQRRCA